MIIYILLPIATILFGIPLCRKKMGKRIYCAVFGVILFVISAIRFTVGYDYILYTNWYNDLILLPMNELVKWSREKGFAIPAKLMADAGLPYQALFAVIAFVIISGVFLYIYNNSDVPWISVTAFLIFGLFFNSMNFMRQFLAAVVIAYSFKYIFSKRFMRFFALVALASVFHISAFIILPFYFILRIKINKYTIMLLSAFAFLSYIFIAPVLKELTEFFYNSYNPETNIEMINGLSPVYTVGFFLFFVLAYLLKDMLVLRNPRNSVLISSMFFVVYFSFLGTSHGIIARLSLIFILPPILLLSADIFSVLKDLTKLTFKNYTKKQEFFYGALIGSFFILISSLFYGYLLSNNYNGVVPYQSILTQDSQGTV